MIRTQVGIFELVEENRGGWNLEAFQERYSDILDKYDYIVGDWGYGQLRMRGFYDNSNRKVPFEQKIAILDEYLQEFCNFGCAYFVLRRWKEEGMATERPEFGGDVADRMPRQRERREGQPEQSPYRNRAQRMERREKQLPHRSPRTDWKEKNGGQRQEKGTRGERPVKGQRTT